MKQWYTTWFDSPFYQLLYDHRNDDEAARFIKNLVNHLKIPTGSKILDLACGNGRHSRQLAEMGMAATGIDLSPASIRLARLQSTGGAQYHVHDMRCPFHFGTFDYVFNLFTSFGYFEDNRDHFKVLQNIKAVLRPKGTFVMDFLSVPYVEKGLVRSETITKKEITFKIKREIAAGYITKEIRFDAKGEKFVFVERVRAFTLEELQQMFRETGFTIQETFGDYNLSPYKEAHSPRLILLAN